MAYNGVVVPRSAKLVHAFPVLQPARFGSHSALPCVEQRACSGSFSRCLNKLWGHFEGSLTDEHVDAK